MSQVQTGVGVKLTGDELSASEFNLVNAAINQNAVNAESRLRDWRVIKTKDEAADFLTATDVYTFPAGSYFFEPIDWGNSRWIFDEVDGCYDIETNCIAQQDYSGTLPFITLAATGQVITLGPSRWSTPNATCFDGILGGNTFNSNFGIFISCEKIIDLTDWAFFTVDAFAGVGCETGCVLTDVANINLSKPQWTLGLDSGGVMFTCIGASSGQMIADSMNSQPAATEFFFDIQSTYAGTVSIVGGNHATGAGAFFKTSGGSRNQDDVAIRTTAVKNVPDSQSKVTGYIADGDEVETTITTQDVPVVIAGAWTAVIENHFTIDAAGKITYIGAEDMIFSIIAKMQVTPASGINKEYSIHVRKNGTTIDLASRDIVRADSGNPAKVVVITEEAFVTNDYIELVIEGDNSTTNVTCSAVTLII